MMLVVKRSMASLMPGSPHASTKRTSNRYGIQATKTDFSTRVKAALEDKTEKVVLIKGDKDAKYSAIMEAMDSLRAVGIEDIGLITEPRKDPNAPAAGGK